MTIKNAVLLTIKQNNGIDYNSLLNKTASSYGNINSARAALSRALKDLGAVQMIQRKGNHVFITDKGRASLNIEMKSKLLLRLNQIVQGKGNISEIDAIVQLLHTLIERGKADSDLLKAAKGSIDFHISDLNEIKKDLDKRARQLNYLSKIFSRQISTLQRLNFNDSAKLQWNGSAVELLRSLPERTGSKDFVAELFSEAFFKIASEKFKAKTQDKTMFLQKSQLREFLKLVERNSAIERNRMNLFFPGIKVKISYPEIYLIGAFDKVQELAKGMRL